MDIGYQESQLLSHLLNADATSSLLSLHIPVKEAKVTLLSWYIQIE